MIWCCNSRGIRTDFWKCECGISLKCVSPSGGYITDSDGRRPFISLLIQFDQYLQLNVQFGACWLYTFYLAKYYLYVFFSKIILGSTECMTLDFVLHSKTTRKIFTGVLRGDENDTRLALIKTKLYYTRLGFFSSYSSIGTE